MPKPSRTPLYFYALEYRNQYQRTHGRPININEAIAACYDDWKALPEEEKQIYKNQYDQWRLQYRAHPGPTNVSTQHVKTKKDLQNKQILHDRDIPCEELKIHYDRFSYERNFLAYKYLPLDISELLSMPIYIINFQIFCKVDEEDGGEFLPAEICLLRYTLADGVTIYRQRFLKTEKIPSGYTSSCLEHAKETHQIPLKDFAEATDNYKQIYQEFKSFLLPTVINQGNNLTNNDDRTRRRYFRLMQPCVFFPALEYEQTSKLLDWIQEKAEGIKPTNETRLVHLASIESLIMVLADLKQHQVSRDNIQKTFENAAYSFMIEERCPFHTEIGVSHCSVARCHAGAKLISAYLNQLYVPERPTSTTTMSERRSQHSVGNHTNQSSIPSMINMPNRMQQSATVRPTTASQQSLPRQHSSSDTNDSIASSYYPSKQSHQHHFSPSNDQITKLQQQNFHRLLSTADSAVSNNNNNNHNHRSVDTNEDAISTSNHSEHQRTMLTQRRQILLSALQSIDKQLEELDIQ